MDIQLLLDGIKVNVRVAGIPLYRGKILLHKKR